MISVRTSVVVELNLLLVALLAAIAGSPAIYEDLARLTPTQAGLASGASALLLVAAAVSSSALTKHIAIETQARLAMLLNLVTATLFFILAGSGMASAGIAVLLPIVMASVGLITGNITANALCAVAGSTATASAVLGLLQFTFAGFLVPTTGVAGRSTTAMAVAMLAALRCAGLTLSVASRAPRDG